MPYSVAVKSAAPSEDDPDDRLAIITAAYPDVEIRWGQKNNPHVLSDTERVILSVLTVSKITSHYRNIGREVKFVDVGGSVSAWHHNGLTDSVAMSSPRDSALMGLRDPCINAAITCNHTMGQIARGDCAHYPPDVYPFLMSVHSAYYFNPEDVWDALEGRISMFCIVHKFDTYRGTGRGNERTWVTKSDLANGGQLYVECRVRGESTYRHEVPHWIFQEVTDLGGGRKLSSQVYMFGIDSHCYRISRASPTAVATPEPDNTDYMFLGADGLARFGINARRDLTVLERNNSLFIGGCIVLPNASGTVVPVNPILVEEVAKQLACRDFSAASRKQLAWCINVVEATARAKRITLESIDVQLMTAKLAWARVMASQANVLATIERPYASRALDPDALRFTMRLPDGSHWPMGNQVSLPLIGFGLWRLSQFDFAGAIERLTPQMPQIPRLRRLLPGASLTFSQKASLNERALADVHYSEELGEHWFNWDPERPRVGPVLWTGLLIGPTVEECVKTALGRSWCAPTYGFLEWASRGFAAGGIPAFAMHVCTGFMPFGPSLALHMLFNSAIAWIKLAGVPVTPANNWAVLAASASVAYVGWRAWNRPAPASYKRPEARVGPRRSQRFWDFCTSWLPDFVVTRRSETELRPMRPDAVVEVTAGPHEEAREPIIGGVREGPAVASAAPIIFDGSPGNQLRAVVNRAAMRVPEQKDYPMDELRLAIQSMYGDKAVDGAGIDYDLDFGPDSAAFAEWYDHLRPHQKARVNEYLAHRLPVRNAQARKAFVKKELSVPPHPESKKFDSTRVLVDPRLIQGTTDEEFLETGRYLWMVAKAQYSATRRSLAVNFFRDRVRVCFLCGLDGIQRGRQLSAGLIALEQGVIDVFGIIDGDDAVWAHQHREDSGAVHIVYYESDDSRFDAHVSRWWKEAELDFYRRFKNLPERVIEHLRNGLDCFGRSKHVSYFVPASRASGVANTSSMNAHSNGARGIIIWNRLIRDFDVRRVSSRFVAEYFKRAAHDMGWEVEFQPRTHLARVNFCSGVFWPALLPRSDGTRVPTLVHGPTPGRCFSKLFWRKAGSSAREWYVGAFANIMCGASHVPFIREIMEEWVKRRFGKGVWKKLCDDARRGRLRPTPEAVRGGWSMVPTAPDLFPATLKSLAGPSVARFKATAALSGTDAADCLNDVARDDLPDYIAGIVARLSAGESFADCARYVAAGDPAATPPEIKSDGENPLVAAEARDRIKLLQKARESCFLPDDTMGIPFTLLQATMEVWVHERYGLDYLRAADIYRSLVKRTDDLEEVLHTAKICKVDNLGVADERDEWDGEGYTE